MCLLHLCWIVRVQVDASAFAALTECIYEGAFDKCENVPSGEDGGFLIQPLGGIAIDMAGPARYYVVTKVAIGRLGAPVRTTE